MNMIEVLQGSRTHANLIHSAGGELYVVGKAVRGFLTGNTSISPEFCVIGLTHEQFDELEINMGNQRIIFCDPLVTIEEYLGQQDLTINSIAVNVRTGDTVDPYNGVQHFFSKILINTSPTFIKNGPIQALKAANYVAEMSEFKASETLIRTISGLRPNMQLITPEQKFSELEKALSSNKPSRFFRTLLKANLLDIVYPEVFALHGIPHDPEHHKDGDAFQHTMRVIDHIASMTHNPLIVWAGLAHDLGKATTPVEMLPKHHDHEKRGRDIVKAMDWLPEKWIEVGDLASGQHMRGHRLTEMRLCKQVKLIKKVLDSPIGLEGFIILLLADKPTVASAFNVFEMAKITIFVLEAEEAYASVSFPPGEDSDKKIFDLKCNLVARKLRDTKNKYKPF